MEVSDEYPTWYKGTLSFIFILEMLAGVISNVVVLFSYHIDKKFNRSVGDKFITNMNIVEKKFAVAERNCFKFKSLNTHLSYIE